MISGVIFVPGPKNPLDLAIGRDHRHCDIELVDERDMGRERHSSCKVRFNRMNLFGPASVPVYDSGTSP